MVICLIHPHTCGFAKTAAWQITRAVTTKVKCSENETPKSHHTRVVQEIYNRFTSMFSSTGSRFAVDFKSFNRKLPELRKKFSTWNSRKAQEREQYLEAFSTDTWDKLSLQAKDEHSLKNCRGCFHKYSAVQSFFPVAAKQFKSCLKDNPTVVAQEISSNIHAKPVKCTRREYKHGAQEIYDRLNPVFEKNLQCFLEEGILNAGPIQNRN
jgi:hypothetical protein